MDTLKTTLTNPNIRIIEWIPCSKRLPDKEGVYLVTQHDTSPNKVKPLYLYPKDVQNVGFWCFGRNFDFTGVDSQRWYELNKIVAWAELPTEYQDNE